MDPNDNLADEYMRTAEETLESLKTEKTNSKIWLATKKYYLEYFSVYSLLMRMGIHCEIHECTIEVCRMLEEESILPSGYAKTLAYDKDLRIDNQYYLKNREVKINYQELLQFILKIKSIHSKIRNQDIENIRRKILGDK